MKNNNIQKSLKKKNSCLSISNQKSFNKKNTKLKRSLSNLTEKNKKYENIKNIKIKNKNNDKNIFEEKLKNKLKENLEQNKIENLIKNSEIKTQSNNSLIQIIPLNIYIFKLISNVLHLYLLNNKNKKTIITKKIIKKQIDINKQNNFINNSFSYKENYNLIKDSNNNNNILNNETKQLFNIEEINSLLATYKSLNYFIYLHLDKNRNLSKFTLFLFPKINDDLKELIYIFIELHHFPELEGVYTKLISKKGLLYIQNKIEEDKLNNNLENLNISTVQKSDSNSSKIFIDNTLTPIPSKKKSKLKKDEIEFVQASRASFVIRRIEYSNYVSSGNKLFSKAMLNKITTKIIFIQRWWRYMMKNNTFYYRIILIQKNWRGYIIKKSFKMAKFINKILFPGLNKIIFVFYKKKIDIFLNKLMNKFANLYNFNFISKKVNIIIKAYKIFINKNKNVFEEIKKINEDFNENNLNYILKNINYLNSITKYKNFINKIKLIQKIWRDYYKRIILNKYKGIYHNIYVNLRKKNSNESKKFNKIYSILIKKFKEKFLYNLYENNIKKKLLFKRTNKIKNINNKINFIILKNNIQKFFQISNKIKQRNLIFKKFYSNLSKVYKKNKLKNYLFKWKKIYLKILSFSFIIIKYIIHNHIHLYFNYLKKIIYKNKEILRPTKIFDKINILIDDKKNILLKKIINKLEIRKKFFYKFYFKKFYYITKIIGFLPESERIKLLMKNKRYLQKLKKLNNIKKFIFLKTYLIKKENNLKLNGIRILRKWKKITYYFKINPKERMCYILIKILSNYKI